MRCASSTSFYASVQRRAAEGILLSAFHETCLDGIVEDVRDDAAHRLPSDDALVVAALPHHRDGELRAGDVRYSLLRYLDESSKIRTLSQSMDSEMNMVGHEAVRN